MKFLPDSGHAEPRESGETMSSRNLIEGFLSSYSIAISIINARRPRLAKRESTGVKQRNHAQDRESAQTTA